MNAVLTIFSVLGGVCLLLLKILLVVLGVFLLLVCVLLFCPMHTDVSWADEVLTVRVGALGLSFPIFRYPQPQTPPHAEGEDGASPKKKSFLKRLRERLPKRKKKSKPPAKPKKQAPPKEKAKLTLDIFCKLLGGAGRIGGAIIGSLRVTKIRIHIVIRGQDAAETGILYGGVNGWLYSCLGWIDRFLYLDFEELFLEPDFSAEGSGKSSQISFRISARLYAIVFTAVRVLFELAQQNVLDVFL